MIKPGDAKKRAEAARKAAAEAAGAAKKKAERATAEVRQEVADLTSEVRESITEVRESVDRFASLPCDRKLQALMQVSEAVVDELQFGAERSLQDAGDRQWILDELFWETIRRHPRVFELALGLTGAVREGRHEDRIKGLIREAACGTDPDSSVAEFSAIVDHLGVSLTEVGSDGDAGARSRSVPVLGKWLEPGFSVSFDVSIGAVVPPAAVPVYVGAGAGIGIAGGTVGSSECPMPRGEGRVGVRTYYYRHAGPNTPELGVSLPLSLGIWAVNPRDLAGRYTIIGGNISFESIGALWAGGTGALTFASGGALAPTTSLSLAGLTGVGLNLAFDQSLTGYIECAMTNRDTWRAECGELPNFVGVTVSAGISASLIPIDAHIFGGADWTWWWHHGIYDPHGPTRLWQEALGLASDELAALRARV